MTRPPVVVLGGEAIAVSVARSLGRRGIPVHALGVASDPVRWSRWCTEFVDLGAGEGVVDRWLGWLESPAAPAGAVVMPCNDDAVELIARHRARLEAAGLVPVEGDDRAARAMLDKDATYAVAEAAGVSAPRSVTVRTPEELRAALDEVGWPAALKPVHSHVFARHFGLLQKVLLADDPEALVAAFAEPAAFGVAMLVTEIVPGEEDAFCSYYSYIDPDGEPLFSVTKRKLRQYPPRFGLGCFHVTDRNPEAAELGLRFFRAAGIRGLACVEFKRDARDGRLRLIECNHRLTLATEQLRRAGADLPWFQYARAAGLPDPDVRYREGVTLWAPARDFRHYLARRGDGDLPFGTWARSVARPHAFLLASVVDPLPAVAAVGSGIRRGARRVSGRAGGRPRPSAAEEVEHPGPGEPDHGVRVAGLADGLAAVDALEQPELVVAEHDRRRVEDPRL